jgi:hypothetical protein
MSAVPIPITNTDPLADAVQCYIDAKRDEDQAKKRRVNAEERILALQPAKEEGAITVEAGGFKLTLTGKLGYACDDLNALREITRLWDANLVPIKTAATLDDTGCKYLRRERPDLWRELASVVTVKPAKTAVSVKV